MAQPKVVMVMARLFCALVVGTVVLVQVLDCVVIPLEPKAGTPFEGCLMQYDSDTKEVCCTECTETCPQEINPCEEDLDSESSDTEDTENETRNARRRRDLRTLLHPQPEVRDAGRRSVLEAEAASIEKRENEANQKNLQELIERSLNKIRRETIDRQGKNKLYCCEILL